MGYDFSYMIIEPRPQAFPFYLAADFDGRVAPLSDARALERRLSSRDGMRLNGPPIQGTQHYRWEGAAGILYLHVGESAVSVDTHAHWTAVLELYEYLLPAEPELLIVDNQTAELYDGPSFRRFVADSYDRKT